jgi:hypothetical protein
VRGICTVQVHLKSVSAEVGIRGRRALAAELDARSGTGAAPRRVGTA